MKTALALVTTLLPAWTCTGFVPKAAFSPRLSLRKAATMGDDKVATESSPSPMADHRHEPKVCIVTGSSQGIGRAIALELGKYGQTVVINHIKGCEEDAEDTVQDVKTVGGDAIAVEADCTHPDEVEKSR